jgi:hypothetical protein
MIDMRKLHTYSYYQWILQKFNHSNCKWSKFKRIHLKVSKLKCPICECALDNSLQRSSNNGTTTIVATIDHYRPKDSSLYPLLRCDDKNYLLMCSDCNNAYKGNNFPLHSSGNVRDIHSTSIAYSIFEKPLIVNPIYDDVLELFILVFRYTPSGKKVLELEPKEATGYLFEKAKETIKLFSLGNCEVNRHFNPSVANCRIGLLNDHFKKFYGFMEALKNKDSNKAFSEKEKNKLENYGFFIFIQKGQFKYLI